MLTDNLFEDIPHDRLLHFNHLLGLLDGRSQTHDLEAVKNEWLEQFKSHELRQTALVQFELRSNDDNRAPGVVDALAEQVLTETPPLALNHVRERLERTLVRAGHGLTTSSVVEQRVHRFLQHSLFVAHDNFRRLQFKQSLQAIIAIDHAAIQIV